MVFFVWSFYEGKWIFIRKRVDEKKTTAAQKRCAAVG